MKVKLFTHINADCLEKEINSFLNQENIIFVDCKLTVGNKGLYCLIFYRGVKR